MTPRLPRCFGSSPRPAYPVFVAIRPDGTIDRLPMMATAARIAWDEACYHPRRALRD